MFLEEFLAELHSCGDFYITENGAIRDKKENLCPVIAVINKLYPEKLMDAANPMVSSMDEFNCVAFDFCETVLQMPYMDALHIITSADKLYIDTEEDRELRKRMLKILRLEETNE